MHNARYYTEEKTATEISSKKRMDSWLNKEALFLGQPLRPGDG